LNKYRSAMRNQMTFAASIATLALLTACTKERLEPMTAVPEARAQISTATMPLSSLDKHAQNDRIITAAVVVDRTSGRVTGSHVHDITMATPMGRTNGAVTTSAARSFTTTTETDRTNGMVTSSAAHSFTSATEIDRTPGVVTGSATGGGGLVPVTDGDAGVCWYCGLTGLASVPEQMPVRLLESDDPPKPEPRSLIATVLLPKHADIVLGHIRHEVPENETILVLAPVGQVAEGVSISDDGSKDE
jgi:hypothetical protein